MRNFQIVVTTVLTTLAVLALLGVGAWSLAPQIAWATGLHTAGEFQPGEHCARFDARHTRLIEAHISAGLDLDEDQEIALRPMIDVIEAWRVDTVAACETMDLGTPGGHLDALETLLTRTGKAVADLKPAFGTFEATLTPDQRADLTALLHHDRHGRGHGH